MDSKAKATRLNGLMLTIQGLDPNSREYGQVLHTIIRENIGLAGCLAVQFKKYLEYNEHNTYLFRATLKAIELYEHGRGSAGSLIIHIAKGMILNDNRSKLREFAKKRKNAVQCYCDNPESLCCDINGYVTEVQYYGREKLYG